MRFNIEEGAMTLWYLSFATDAGFRGATVVEAADAQHALRLTVERGLNPGGQVAILQVPADRELAPDIVAIRDRLATRDEMMALQGIRLGDLPKNMRSRFEAARVRFEECTTSNASSSQQQCPTCGEPVESIFDHIDRDCRHD
jgi:hypothetical protein